MTKKDKLRRAKSKKASSFSTQRAKAKMQHKPSENCVSLKATPAHKISLLKQSLKPTNIDRDVAEEINQTKNIGALLRKKGKTISSLKTMLRVAIYNEAAKLYAVAQRATRDTRLWNAICADQDWAKYERQPTEADQPDALRFVMLRAFNGYTRRGQQRASKYFCALKGFFKAEVPANEIPGKIKESRGIEALARANANGAEKTTTNIPSKRILPPDLESDGKPRARQNSNVVLRGTLIGEGIQLLQFKPPCRARLLVEVQARSGSELEVLVTKAVLRNE